MKCPKCNYVSFDYLDACRKCGRDLINFKREVGLQVIRPGDLDLSLVISSSAASSGRDDFNLDANFFGGQLFGQGGGSEADEAEFDISLDDDLPMSQATASPTTTSHGEVTDDEDTFILADTMAETLPAAPPLETPSSALSSELTADLIDMSELEDLETSVLDLQETIGTHSGRVPPPPDDSELTLADTMSLDKTLETTRVDPPPPARAAADEIVDLNTEDLLDTELELELDALGEESLPAGADTELLNDLEKLRLHDDEQNNPRPPERP
jgi:hypothetical protein